MTVDVPRVVFVALVVSVTGALVVGGATSGVAFDSFNPDWDGTSELRTTAENLNAEPVVVRNTTRYDAYGDDTVAFVIAPDRTYDDRDADRVRAFVEGGGTLVVADRDGPSGHALLASVGADARPAGPILRDDRHYRAGPALPVASNVSNHSLTAGVESLTLNHGTAVEPNGATVLVSTSEFAYLDVDGSGDLSDDETVASYPVATVEAVGDGQVVVVGDPSVFINVMQGESGNHAFVEALVSETGDEHALVDVSHASSPPPLIGLLLTIRESVVLQVGVVIAALAAIGVSTRALLRRDPSDASRQSVDHETLTQGLTRLYPEFDPDRLERLTKGVIRESAEGDDDE